MKRKNMLFVITSVALVAVVAGGVLAQRGPGRGQGFGKGGPGFRGGRQDPTFEVDHEVFHFLLDNGDKIRRQVKNVKDGIETVTESDDPEITVKIQEHVAAMYDRLEEKRPIHMRDPLFRELFRHVDKIEMKLEETENGVHVTETSKDPFVAKLLQEHAKVVSLFIKNGRAEAHKNHPVPSRDGSAAVDEGELAPAGCCKQAGECCKVGKRKAELGQSKLKGTECCKAGCQTADGKGGGSNAKSGRSCCCEQGKPGSEADAQQAFAHFDEAYIPALALTKQEKAGPSKAALRQLTQRWKQLHQNLARSIAADSKWPQDIETIDAAIASSVQQAQEGQLAKAHETLEVIRDLMMEARRRQEISYPLDSLSDFHSTMEDIAKPAMQFTPQSVTDEFIRGLDALAEVAEEKWKIVEAVQFDLELFDIETSAAARLRGFVADERDAISKLQSALTDGDKQAIIKAARGVKPPFAKVYMFFGDFPKPVTSAATAAEKG